LLPAEALAMLGLNFAKHLLQRLATLGRLALRLLTDGASAWWLGSHLASLGTVGLFIGFYLFGQRVTRRKLLL
jgi:hypothetical protein